MLGNRKFSINRNTGVPKPARRFSSGEGGLSGMISPWALPLASPILPTPPARGSLA